MNTERVRDVQQTKQCVYITCDCDRCYIGKTSRLLEVRIKEHKYNRTQSLLEKSKLAQHTYEESHKICWNEAKALPKTTYRKYSESAHMSLVNHPIISPIWTPLLQQKQKKKKKKTPSGVDCVGNLFFVCWYHKE
jgi:predicted GIY-YIG superfamily endonuclease